MAYSLLDLPDELLDMIINKYSTPFEWREFRQINKQAHSIFARINNVNSLRDIVPVLDTIINMSNIANTEYAERYAKHMKRNSVIRRIAYKLHLLLYRSGTINFVYTDDLLDKLVTLSCDFMLTYCNSPKYNRNYTQYCDNVKYMHKVRARVGKDYVCTKNLYYLPYVSIINLSDIVGLYIEKLHTRNTSYYKVSIYRDALLNNIGYRLVYYGLILCSMLSDMGFSIMNASLFAIMYIDPIRGINRLVRLHDLNSDMDKFYKYINPLLIDDTLIRLIKNILRNKIPHIVSRSYNALKLQQCANPDMVLARVLADIKK